MIWNERKSFESIIKYGHYSRIRFNFRHAMMEFFGMLWVTSKEFKMENIDKNLEDLIGPHIDAMRHSYRIV